MAIPTGTSGQILSAAAKVNKALAIAMELELPDSVLKRLSEAYGILDGLARRTKSAPKAGPTDSVDTDLLAELEAARAENAKLQEGN